MNRVPKVSGNSTVQLCEEIGPIKSLVIHPKCYTALLLSNKSLVLYDLFSL
jgi:hypothetical protein